METGTLKVVGIIGACILGVILLGKGEEIRRNRKIVEKASTYLTTTLPSLLTFNDYDAFFLQAGPIFSKSMFNQLKQSYGSCTIDSKPKCKPYTRSGGCPYTRDSVRCHIDLNCQKVGHVNAQIDLTRSGNVINGMSFGH